MRIYNTNASLVVKDRLRMGIIHPHIHIDTIGFLSLTEINIDFVNIKWRGHYLNKNPKKLRPDQLYLALSRPIDNIESNRGHFEIVIDPGELIISNNSTVLTNAFVTMYAFRRHPAEK